jgi:hypothetical protein
MPKNNSKKKTFSKTAQRLVDIAWGVYQGDWSSLDSLKKQVLSSGREWIEKKDETGRVVEVAYDAPSGMRIGLTRGNDPLTILYQILFSFFGAYWVFSSHAKEAVELLHLRWEEELKELKATKKSIKEKPQREVPSKIDSEEQ